MASGPREVASAYDRLARRYQDWPWQDFWRQNERPLLEEVMSSEPFGRTALDVGIGTGAYVDLNESHTGRLLGVDISSGMLRELRRLHPGASGVVANATALPFRDGTIDRISANRVLSHVPDLTRFFGEARRLLSPGGGLVISDLDHEHDYDEITFSGLTEVNPIRPCHHSLTDLLSMSSQQGFGVDRYWRLRFRDLKWQPPPDQFVSLDRTNRRHIFYVVVLHRSGH
ncbi:class I SAM-dependent methyltransferase [Nucisporomicrobium flavum]|uniref:class I SAM-dependent methyltransferase n=1 Tax=Nucisporomicrobium flavum TaxID=2785915 RepID=UPI003C30A5BB